MFFGKHTVRIRQGGQLLKQCAIPGKRCEIVLEVSQVKPSQLPTVALIVWQGDRVAFKMELSIPNSDTSEWSWFGHRNTD